MKNFKDLIKVADVYGTETRQAHELSEATLDENWFTDSVNAIKNALGISDDEAKKLIDKNCDFLVLNFPLGNNKIFSSNRNNGLILNRELEWTNIGYQTKKNFAKKMIQHIIRNSDEY